jgi:phosphoglycolate phosphatase
MNKLNNIKTIFFDYDGTLHNSIKIYAPAFRKAYDFLVKEGYAKEKTWEDKEISSWLGFSSKEMWKNFMPNLDENIKNKASKIIGLEMINQIKAGEAELYEETLNILEYLKNKGYTLVFISNCNNYYMNLHKEVFRLDKYFTNMVCSEDYEFISKSDILRIIKSDYKEDMVIIGDRVQDMEAGINNNIYTIGCLYGFGSEEELKQSNFKIENIKKLREII